MAAQNFSNDPEKRRTAAILQIGERQSKSLYKGPDSRDHVRTLQIVFSNSLVLTEFLHEELSIKFVCTEAKERGVGPNAYEVWEVA